MISDMKHTDVVFAMSSHYVKNSKRYFFTFKNVSTCDLMKYFESMDLCLEKIYDVNRPFTST